MRERQRPRQVSNRGLHGAREIPCKPPLGARNQKSRDQGTGCGSKNDQCLLRTWPLERLAFQSPHLPHPFHPATGSYCTGCSRRQNRMPGNPDCLPAPSPPSRPAAAQFVCRGLHTRIGLPFFFSFFLSSQFSSVPKFTPSGTSASAPPLLGTAFCLSGRAGSMGVCDDNNTRALYNCILQALRRQPLMRLGAGVRPDSFICKLEIRGSEVRREGSGDQRPGLPGCWSPSEVRAIRNNESPILEEEGSPAAT